MAVLRVDPQYLMACLLPGALVNLTAVRLDEYGQLYLTVEGSDVPDCEEVVAVITQRQESVEFRAIK